jgi:hypothetical protein
VELLATRPGSQTMAMHSFLSLTISIRLSKTSMYQAGHVGLLGDLINFAFFCHGF